ncbi:hypothetical protein CKAH01_09564 [Colletotrichum kahawae]|uniref:Uncharacterized protein n=1 Tax=Colletotrichum kahawae TaxID=34407 RepID=A0AAD9XZV1_COLKA|nr:hypothetical protein CKAH01_09564 [Colletotrichum kahawae]
MLASSCRLLSPLTTWTPETIASGALESPLWRLSPVQHAPSYARRDIHMRFFPVGIYTSPPPLTHTAAFTRRVRGTVTQKTSRTGEKERKKTKYSRGTMATPPLLCYTRPAGRDFAYRVPVDFWFML